MDDNNPTKNDRKDPKVIAGLINEGRYSSPYLPDGIYVDLRTASNLRFQVQWELIRASNHIQRWFSIYFPENNEIYRRFDAISNMMVLKQAALQLQKLAGLTLVEDSSGKHKGETRKT